MFNANLFTVRNVLVIVVFAVAAQLILSRANAWMHKADAPQTADA